MKHKIKSVFISETRQNHLKTLPNLLESADSKDLVVPKHRSNQFINTYTVATGTETLS